MRRRRAVAVLAILGIAAVTLIAVELASGALDYGERADSDDPCTARVAFAGEGLDATVQRIALDGLNGAACRLGTTREELVLSLDPSLGQSRWDRPTIERAVRAGLLHAIDEAEDRGSLGGIEASLLRELVRRAPIDWLIRGATSVADLFDTLQDNLGDLLDELGGGE